MEKIKSFLKDHKKEIAVSCGIIFAYRLGYHKGFETYDKAVANVFKEMEKNGYNVFKLLNV